MTDASERKFNKGGKKEGNSEECGKKESSSFLVYVTRKNVLVQYRRASSSQHLSMLLRELSRERGTKKIKK
jgi:hypothetical protein